MRVEQGCRLTIYVGEADKHDRRPLYEWIVAQAHERQLAGATVSRGLMGFGPHTRVIHTVVCLCYIFESAARVGFKPIDIPFGQPAAIHPVFFKTIGHHDSLAVTA